MTTLDNLPMTVWINVTTSVNWQRPPVGIVRVELAIANELEKLLGTTKFKRCIWNNNQFIEYTPSYYTDENINADIKKSEISPGDILISVGLDWDVSCVAYFYTLKSIGVKIITCLYDLIPILFPQWCIVSVAQRFIEYLIHLSWGSSAVLCISKQTQLDYQNFCKQLGAPLNHTCIIPLGDSVPSNLGNVTPEISSIGESPFILFVSTIERRKNHEVLYRAYHLLAKAGHTQCLPKMVFVGMPGWGINDMMKDIELDPLTTGLIIQLYHVSDKELNLLYKQALFCVYPSLYEGWGLPVAEALSLGKAVIASDQGSLPEVGGELVRYVSPWNTQGWADAILEWIQHPDLVQNKEQEIRKNYTSRTWKGTALIIKDLINELLTEEKTEITLYPGYDCYTEVGLSIGACLKALGENSGFLMYGPYKKLNAGKYTITIWDDPTVRNEGKVTIDFVINRGKNKLFEAENYPIVVTEDGSLPLIKFEIQAEQDISDYEIRCWIFAQQQLVIKKIVITQV